MAHDDIKKKYKKIIDRELLQSLSSAGCPVCGRPFTLGDPVVYACGAWEGPMKLVHENEAVFDPKCLQFVANK